MKRRKIPVGERKKNRYGVLFALLVTSFLVSGVEDSRLVRMIGGLLIIGMLIMAVTSPKHRIRRGVGAALMLVAVAGTIALGQTDVDDFSGALGASAFALVVGWVMIWVIMDILSHPKVTNQTLLGVLSAYFLLGQFFAWVYTALPGFLDEPVIDPDAGEGLTQYYSYVVLTTLGFGDVTPVGTFAQRITVMEALVGQLFLATLVARLVALYGRTEEEEWPGADAG